MDLPWLVGMAHDLLLQVGLQTGAGQVWDISVVYSIYSMEVTPGCQPKSDGVNIFNDVLYGLSMFVSIFTWDGFLLDRKALRVTDGVS